ncbi:MAG: DUF1330 domain-containing protein [Pseudomonadota bacterium]
MTNYINPTKEQIEHFNHLGLKEPILMLNMLKFRAKADYPDGSPNHGKDMTGAQAYAEYAKAIAPMLQKIGAKMQTFGMYEATLIGPDEAWDEVFIMHYPAAGLFLEMAVDPHYVKDVQPHRTAAVEDSRLIRVRAAESPVG